MRIRTTTAAVVVALLAVGSAACSSSSSSPKQAPAAAPTTTTSPTTASTTAAATTAPKVNPASSAAATFATVAMSVPTSKLGRTVTAENDPNHLLGRPGQYTSKVTFTDSRIKEGDVQGENADSVARGGAVEAFASEADAQRRADYIQGIVKSMPAAMEYDYVKGTVLIRVSKLLTPAQAESYKAAIGA